MLPKNPPPSVRPIHRPALRQGALALTLLALLAQAAAHDWPSPSAPPASVRHADWPGLLWAGPHSGAPPAPSATDCDRPPQAIELDGPQSPERDRNLGHLMERRDAAAAAEAPAAPPASSKVESAASPAAALADRAERAEGPALRHPMPTEASPQRPSAEPVTAGVVDDNADFGAYMDFHRRHARLSPRSQDVSERYQLTVHDAEGRPVPDAEVALQATRGGPVLHARTDAGGQVWLHPRVAGLAAGLIEVQVRKASADGMLQGSAVLRRGQRDALQVSLDSADAAQPARLDLVFLVDATGSMADEIDKLRQSMQTIADEIAALPSRPRTCFALVAYRDRGDAFFVRAHDFTSDLAAFQRVLGGLRANGGGDYPEALNEALHTAVHRLSWRGDGATRLLLLVADAPPHLDRGAPWYDDDMQGALARGIKLFTLGASGLDRRGEVVFRQLAQFTGGRFVFLTYEDARRPGSGPGRETVHEVRNYSVQTLDRLIVKLVREELARRPA